MRSLIFLSVANDFHHLLVKSKPIGGSEFQFYTLIDKLKEKYNITCYNQTKSSCIIEGVHYKNYKEDLPNDILDKDTCIIVARCMPDFQSLSYNKIKNNRIYLWWQDHVCTDSFISRCPYLGDYPEPQKTIYLNMNSKVPFRRDILSEFVRNKNIHNVFNSEFTQKENLSFLREFDIVLDHSNQHIIYNAVFPDSLIKPDPILLNVNQLVYASAWTKGIRYIVSLFKYICENDPDFKLVLMSPGYEWENMKSSIPILQQMFGERITILGPTDKKEYAEIISSSLCTFTGRFYETFGCVFAESYYLGTPVIADIYTGAVKEFIDPAHIVNFDKPEEVFRLLNELRMKRLDMNISLKPVFLEEYVIQQWMDLTL